MWHLESIAELRRLMRTFVCIVPVTRRRVTTDNGESLQRRERLCAGRSIRLFQRTRAKQAWAKRALCAGTVSARVCKVLHCDVMYAQAPQATGVKGRAKTARAEGPGT